MKNDNQNLPKRRLRKRSFRIAFEQAVNGIFEEMGNPLTVRQIFYALTVRGIIQKTENGYHQTCYYLAEMRRDMVLPYSWIADNTRWRIKPDTYSDISIALNTWSQKYRRDIWAELPDTVEIWCEKDALAGVISPITDMYDVPLYIARGYSSMTFLYNAAETIKQIGKPTYIYQFGDFDPSGIDAAKNIRDELQNHGAKITFYHIAVTQDQIQTLDLPTRPTKKQDPRSKLWGNTASVELDALPSPILRRLVQLCINRHVDDSYVEQIRRIEEAEKHLFLERISEI
jgi:hypothetical protein